MTYPNDLLVLAADPTMRLSVEAILMQPEKTGISIGSYKCYEHPKRDPGCLLESHTFLRSFSTSYKYCAVLFDREGCGKEKRSRLDLESLVEEKLEHNGWPRRCVAIAIDPELEAWVWSPSKRVADALGWSSQDSLSEWLIEQGYDFGQNNKPVRPKEAMEAVLRHCKRPKSPTHFQKIAQTVNLNACVDPSFLKFRNQLQAWFPRIA